VRSLHRPLGFTGAVMVAHRIAAIPLSAMSCSVPIEAARQFSGGSRSFQQARCVEMGTI